MIDERIKEKRKEYNLSQKKVAKEIGVTATTVSLWENGITSPKGNNLFKLAKCLNCTPEYLLYGTIISKNYDFYNDNYQIDVYKNIDDLNNCVSCKKISVSKEVFDQKNIKKENSIGLIVTGNSMKPCLPNGSIVMIDRSNKFVIDGSIYAIDHGGLLRIIIIYKRPNNGIRLRSFNSKEWPEENLEFEDLSKIKILGKVFWYSVMI